MSRGSDNIEAFWTSNDRGIDHASFNGDAWDTPFVFSPGSTASENATFGMSSRLRSHLELLWTGGDGSLQEAFWQPISWTRRQVVASGNVTTAR